MALIHTCYRITDIDRSVAFYNALGFEEIGRIPIGDEAVNVFMNQPGDGNMPRLELTYNFGVDSYEIGTGYGHIAITAEDLDATLARLAEQGIEPEKPPYSVREGGSRLCFVQDPEWSDDMPGGVGEARAVGRAAQTPAEDVLVEGPHSSRVLCWKAQIGDPTGT